MHSRSVQRHTHSNILSELTLKSKIPVPGVFYKMQDNKGDPLNSSAEPCKTILRNKEPGRRSRFTQFLIYLWVLPTSAVAMPLLVMSPLTGGRIYALNGLLEVEGTLVRWLLKRSFLSASAITLGHVVLYADEASRKKFRCHELVHVRQAERWGPFFLPCYLVLGFLQG